MLHLPLAVFGLGGSELMIVGGVCVLLFGHRLPKIMREVGRSKVAFERGLHEAEDEVQETPSLEEPSIQTHSSS